MSITVELNSLSFEVPTKSDRDWGSLSDWILEVNEILATTNTSNIIPQSTANLINATAVNLYTVNTPSTNAHIILEYGINRVTTGIGAVNVSETGVALLAYSTDGNWQIATNAVGDATVAITVSGANVIQATATALAGDISGGTSIITYTGRILPI